MATKRIFSGIQPTGIIHLGNYLGAIKQWVDIQNNPPAGGIESIFCVVDLHAITVRQDPQKLHQNILSTAAWYLACGIDPEKSAIFIQSERPEHTELAWVLNTFTQMGELSRMTQYKEKTERHGENAGLFTYPTLMAADILLYQANLVPVGEDQIQHVELTRDIAKRFNNIYGETFVVPEHTIKIGGKRIMGLDDPAKKMSKSAASEYNYIALSDSPDKIRQKIKKAVTDSGTQIKHDTDQPAVSNLLNIYSEITSLEVAEVEDQYLGKGYGDFKSGLAEAIVAHLSPIQQKHDELMANGDELIAILRAGSEKIAPIAQATLKDVRSKLGLINF